MTREEIERFEELIPLRQGGLMIGVPYETMRRYVRLRIIPYYKIGGRLKVHKGEIREWYGERKVAPLASASNPSQEVRFHEAIRHKTEGAQPAAAVGSVHRQ